MLRLTLSQIRSIKPMPNMVLVRFPGIIEDEMFDGLYLNTQFRPEELVKAYGTIVSVGNIRFNPDDRYRTDPWKLHQRSIDALIPGRQVFIEYFEALDIFGDLANKLGRGMGSEGRLIYCEQEKMWYGLVRVHTIYLTTPSDPRGNPIPKQDLKPEHLFMVNGYSIVIPVWTYDTSGVIDLSHIKKKSHPRYSLLVLGGAPNTYRIKGKDETPQDVLGMEGSVVVHKPNTRFPFYTTVEKVFPAMFKEAFLLQDQYIQAVFPKPTI